MKLHEYARYDAVGLRDLIRAGEVTAGEVEAVAREAIAIANAELNGLALPPFSPALHHAADGQLAGVPFLIKDHGPVAEGVPFFLGSRAIPGILAQRDTDLMARFRAAGLVTLGLTAVPELVLSFATESLRYGPTHNPWDRNRGVGGSSGGAAAMIAAGAVPLAHASDGAGSIRVPASCCGLVGLKPSRGRVPCGPDLGEPMLGMAYEFALTRTVRDAAHLLDAVQGPGIGDKYTAPPPRGRYADEREPGPLRVAVTTEPWSGTSVDGEVAQAAIQTGRMMERLGHPVMADRPELSWNDVLASCVAEGVAIASMLLRAPRQPDPAQLEAVSRELLSLASEYTALDMMNAFDAQNRVTRSVASFFTRYDLLITPTLGRLPAPHGTLRYNDPSHTFTTWLDSMFDYSPFTMVFNVSGHPAISLPLGHSATGLPIGVQLIAPYGREDLLFQTATQLEHAMPWDHRVPGFSIRNH
ncbi:amidase family protein [Acrocarpospora macrocephala]|uniref:Amidase n=1 Tax=Acrocarpospora macrocephala TaxID=150177 RepID=A0A5M3WWA8_9ACTN|nr:amidase family protein [Acrocarpospora macrocephala]GES10448.1 amidase [Acrocarpospora macrocephala]